MPRRVAKRAACVHIIMAVIGGRAFVSKTPFSVAVPDFPYRIFPGMPPNPETVCNDLNLDSDPAQCISLL